MDEINTVDASATVEPVQGHLIEVLAFIDGVEPIYRTNLGFRDSTSQHEKPAPATPAKP